MSDVDRNERLVATAEQRVVLGRFFSTNTHLTGLQGLQGVEGDTQTLGSH